MQGLTDPFYAPIQMADGRYLYGAAAFAYRVKLGGGPTAYISHGLRSMLDFSDTVNHQHAVAMNSSKVVKFPARNRRRAA